MKSELPSVLHVITGTGVGGAERMLQKLVQASEGTLLRNSVVSLTDIGLVGKEIRDFGVRVDALRMRRNLPSPMIPRRISLIANEVGAGVIQTWMYHADLLGGLGAGGRPVVWGIRQSRLDADATRRSTLFVAKLCARLSKRLPAKILCNSRASVDSHAAYGYDRSRMTVIPNGFDTERFRPQDDAKEVLCQELGLSDSSILLGTVARLDAAKDIPNALAAASALMAENPRLHLVLVGRGLERENPEFASLLSQFGFGAGQPEEARLHALGVRRDLDRIVPAFDVFFLASLGEGFPNALGEAMSCGVPSVSTDAGDCALIGGGDVPIVPVQNSEALRQAIHGLLDESQEQRSRRSDRLRQRIVNEYSLEATAEAFAQLYREVLN